MAAPSVVKIKKGELVYETSVDLAKYTIRELTRRALMDVGRYVSYNVRKNLGEAFPWAKKKKNPQRYGYWVLKRENWLLLGIENRKHGAKTAWWADQLELDSFLRPTGMRAWRQVTGESSAAKPEKTAGSKAKATAAPAAGLGSAHAPRRHLLETFVKHHYDKIVEIESKYLKMINNEDAAVALARATEEMEVLQGDEG